MKNILMSIGALAFIIVGVYFYQPKKPVGIVPPKFFNQSQILRSDTVVKVAATGFEPSEVTIKKGTRVVWVNESADFVWPASNPHPTHTDYAGLDPLEPFKKDEAWAFVFDRVGSFGYHDHLHPSSKGTITVTE